MSVDNGSPSEQTQGQRARREEDRDQEEGQWAWNFDLLGCAATSSVNTAIRILSVTLAT
jgi:hypothetical protein